MFRVTPWSHYQPSNKDNPERNLSLKQNNSDMDDDVDMEAPQISILQDEKTPPPSSSAPLRTSKFRVKLLVNDKKHGSSQASRDDEQEDDEEEDELIDDEDDELKSTISTQVAPSPARGAAASKRGNRSKGRVTGAGTNKRKSAKPNIPEQGPVMTWFEVSGPDVESAKPAQPGDTWETASVASVNTPSTSATKKKAPVKAGARGARKSGAKQLKVPVTALKDDADNISEAAYTATAASSPVIRENSLEPENIAPSAMSVPSMSATTAEESLEGVALPIYPLPSKPFPVLPPQKMGSGFAPVMPLDKSGKKVRHWRPANREIRGIAGGRWFARSWAGEKDSEYATAVAAGMANPPAANETDKTNAISKPPNTSNGSKNGSKGKQQKVDTAPSSRSSSVVPDLPPSRTTSGPSKMRTSLVAPPVDEEDVQLPPS